MRPDVLRRTVRTALLLTSSALVVIAISGCQEQPTTVSGAVTLDGHPLTVPKDARGTVVFQPDGGHGSMATGLLDSAGHFNLATGSSPEVAQGKYYVTVSVAQLLPKTEDAEQGAKLITPVRYSSSRDSGLAADVKPGENRINFNLLSTAGDATESSSSKSSDDSPAAAPSSPKSPSESK